MRTGFQFRHRNRETGVTGKLPFFFRCGRAGQPRAARSSELALRVNGNMTKSKWPENAGTAIAD